MANLLQTLPEYVVYWLVKNGKERSLNPGDRLLCEGALSPAVYIVLDGLFRLGAAGTGDRAHDHIAPGSILGELSFFTGEPEPASATAEEQSLVLEIPRRTLASKLQHDPGYASDFYRAVIHELMERLRVTTRKLRAAEDGEDAELLREPQARRAREMMSRFKGAMTELDKRGIKQGGLSEEDYRAFFALAMEVMGAAHQILGPASTLTEPVRQRLGAQLQHEMLPYLLTTRTAERFYSKPRGYAGDYLAIDGIYQNAPGGTGRLGPLMDRMFLETPPAIAVRNRRILLADEIVRVVQSKPAGPVNVLCLASGPAAEVFDAFAALPDPTRLKVTLMDIDLHALAFVDELRTKRKLTSQITLINENLVALFLGRSKTRLDPMDLIYSIGLIDYLNDKLVNKVLHFSHGGLVRGGRVILGNFHPRNPAREFMDHVMEWNLIHRTEEDMNRLFKDSPFARSCTKIQFEPLGIDLFAECERE